jgi:acetyl-CoA C-acetyltransferase
MALLEAGWPVKISGVTLDAVYFGAMKIMSGLAGIVFTGGVESMSRAEFYIPGEFVKEGMGGRIDPD